MLGAIGRVIIKVVQDGLLPALKGVAPPHELSAIIWLNVEDDTIQKLSRREENEN